MLPRFTQGCPGRGVFVALLITGAFAAACGGDDRPAEVTLAELTMNQERYADREVVTSGIVRRERVRGGDRLYVLTDAQQNLVALSPSAGASAHTGKTVTVTGVFQLDPQQGRVLRFEQIRRGTP